MAGWARIACSALAAALCACSRPEPLRVGFVSGLTGRHYGLGLSSRNGVTLAVEELNAAGGIGGRPLDLLVRDDEQDPAAARRAVEELVEAGVVAIIGHATSAMAEATLPIVDARRVLMISPTVSASAFERRDDWLVLLYPSTAVSGRVTANHLLSRGVRRVTAILDLSNEPYVRSWHDAFKAALEAGGGAVPRVITFTSGRVASYAALVEGAAPPGTDCVVLVANALDSATLAQQLRKRGPVQIVGSEWAFTNDVVVHGGAAVEGAIFPQKVNLEDASPRFVRFRQAYEARFNRPVDFAAVTSYEAVTLLADALRRDPTREGVRRAVLEAGRYEGLQGPVEIDVYGDARRPHHMMTVRDGKMSLLE